METRDWTEHFSSVPSRVDWNLIRKQELGQLGEPSAHCVHTDVWSYPLHLCERQVERCASATPELEEEEDTEFLSTLYTPACALEHTCVQKCVHMHTPTQQHTHIVAKEGKSMALSPSIETEVKN